MQVFFMDTQNDQAEYRIHRFFEKDDKPLSYRDTFEITDDRTKEVLARCDLLGQAVFSKVEIFDKNRQVWQMAPNRKVMPSRWILRNPEKHIAMQFDQKVLGKFINPVYRAVLVLLDWDEKVKYRLVDPRKNIPDRIMSINTGDWAIMDGDRPAAKLTWLPRQEIAATGFMGKLKKFLIPSDRAIVSAGTEHCLNAPAALAMYIVFSELADTSGG